MEYKLSELAADVVERTVTRGNASLLILGAVGLSLIHI